MTEGLNSKKFDLTERTKSFSKDAVSILKLVPENTINRPIISQTVRSITSIGANYCEADNAESRNDFKHKIAICKKEAKEASYWLEILVSTNPELESKIKPLLQEAKELTLIFNAIMNKTKENAPK